jgi:hypothetical protein
MPVPNDVDVADLRTVSRRRELFTPLWRYYLENPTVSVSTLQAQAVSFFGDHGSSHHSPALRFREAHFTALRPSTFTGLVELNRNTAASCSSFLQGLSSLRTALANGTPEFDTIPKAFNQMDDLWAQWHHVAAVGAFLSEVAASRDILSDIERSFTVSFEGQSRVFGS